MKHRLWNEAIQEIEGAQASLKIFPAASAILSPTFTRMLAECYRQTGRDEQRLAVLQSVPATTGPGSSDDAQLALADALTKSGGPGELAQALRILQSLAEKRPGLELDIARLEFGVMLRKPQAERNWRSVDRQIDKAEKALASKRTPAVDEAFIVLRARVKEAKGQPEAALDDLRAAAATHPDNPNYIVALFEKHPEAGRQERRGAEHPGRGREEAGTSPVIRLARLVYWGTKGGPKAKAEVAKLANLIKQGARSRKTPVPRPACDHGNATRRAGAGEAAHVRAGRIATQQSFAAGDFVRLDARGQQGRSGAEAGRRVPEAD